MQNIKHLLWRFGFGPAAQDWNAWQSLSPLAAWRKLKSDSAPSPEYFDVADNAIKGLVMGVGEIGRMEKRELDKEEKKKLKVQSREDIKNLNLRWLEEMVATRAQLREKIALFWHGHFASRNINILYQQQLLGIIRQHALGNFGDLLRAVSKSAAMLAFLNNQQNKKQHPNENFAREVMELFTLGRGHYTEADIKEAARAFTGWGFQLDGDFVFRKRNHDTGAKTILGITGHFTGDDVLDILLQQRQTARFIAAKLYRYLVNEQHAPDFRLDELGDRFFDSGYDITVLLDAIATSDWFFEEKNVGMKIKSPIELWVGIRRVLPVQLDNAESQLLLQKALGQILFYPPNVAGWPGGKTWIDASSLMLRLRLPQLLAGGDELQIDTKEDDDQLMGQMAAGKGSGKLAKRFRAEINWEPALRLFAGRKAESLTDNLAQFLWQLAQPKPPLSVIHNHSDQSTRDAQFKTILIQLMATPEYQVC